MANEGDIKVIKNDIRWIKEKVKCIEKKVNNDIPHKIEALDNKFDKEKDANNKWRIGLLVALVFNLVGVILMLVIK